MASETSIINRALRQIGGTRVTSREDGTNVADDIFDEVRDDLLRSNPWNFATKRATLAKSAVAPGFEFDYAFPLPSDWIRTISVHHNDAGAGVVAHKVEIVNDQLSIVANTEDCYLVYVFQQVNPNLMPSDFLSAFTDALARDMAIAIADSNVLQGTMADKADRSLMHARASDAMSGTPSRRPRGSWTTSRGGAYGSSRDWPR